MLQGRRYLPHSIPADFSGTAEKILDHEYNAHPRSFAPTGELLIHEASSSDRSNIMVLPEDRGSPWFAVRTEFDERAPEVSPNGAWLVYSSDRSGEEEVYVEPFPDGGPRIQVSTGLLIEGPRISSSTTPPPHGLARVSRFQDLVPIM